MNYYEILGIKYDATQDEIKTAYRTLAKIYHPDNVKTGSEEEMKKITEAYQVLSDIEKRKSYDRTIKVNINEEARNASYSSYTRTKEETESDFEDWLKDIINFYQMKASNLRNFQFDEDMKEDVEEVKEDIKETMNSIKNEVKGLFYRYKTKYESDESSKKLKILRRI